MSGDGQAGYPTPGIAGPSGGPNTGATFGEEWIPEPGDKDLFFSPILRIDRIAIQIHRTTVSPGTGDVSKSTDIALLISLHPFTEVTSSHAGIVPTCTPFFGYTHPSQKMDFVWLKDKPSCDKCDTGINSHFTGWRDFVKKHNANITSWKDVAFCEVCATCHEPEDMASHFASKHPHVSEYRPVASFGRKDLDKIFVSVSTADLWPVVSKSPRLVPAKIESKKYGYIQVGHIRYAEDEVLNEHENTFVGFVEVSSKPAFVRKAPLSNHSRLEMMLLRNRKQNNLAAYLIHEEEGQFLYTASEKYDLLQDTNLDDIFSEFVKLKRGTTHLRLLERYSLPDTEFDSPYVKDMFMYDHMKTVWLGMLHAIMHLLDHGIYLCLEKDSIGVYHAHEHETLVTTKIMNYGHRMQTSRTFISRLCDPLTWSTNRVGIWFAVDVNDENCGFINDGKNLNERLREFTGDIDDNDGGLWKSVISNLVSQLQFVMSHYNGRLAACDAFAANYLLYFVNQPPPQTGGTGPFVDRYRRHGVFFNEYRELVFLNTFVQFLNIGEEAEREKATEKRTLAQITAGYQGPKARQLQDAVDNGVFNVDLFNGVTKFLDEIGGKVFESGNWYNDLPQNVRGSIQYDYNKQQNAWKTKKLIYLLREFRNSFIHDKNNTTVPPEIHPGTRKVLRDYKLTFPKLTSYAYTAGSLLCNMLLLREFYPEVGNGEAPLFEMLKNALEQANNGALH